MCIEDDHIALDLASPLMVVHMAVCVLMGMHKSVRRGLREPLLWGYLRNYAYGPVFGGVEFPSSTRGWQAGPVMDMPVVPTPAFGFRDLHIPVFGKIH